MGCSGSPKAAVMPGLPPPESGSELFLRRSTISCSSKSFGPTAAFLWSATGNASRGVFDVANLETQGPRDRATPESTVRAPPHRRHRRLQPPPSAFMQGDQTVERCHGRSAFHSGRLLRCQHRQPAMGEHLSEVLNRRRCGTRRKDVRTKLTMFYGAKSHPSRSKARQYNPPKQEGNVRCCAS